MTTTTGGIPTKNEAPATHRAAINRANSQHSTGPRTEAGKQRSALNALRHGLTGQTIVLPSDDLIAYERHCKGFFLEHQPKADTERFLVQTMADVTWRLFRISGLENNLLTLGIIEHEHSVDTDHPQVLTGLAMAKTYRAQNQVIANLGLHENRLGRLFDKTLKQLLELQAERRRLEKEQLQDAAIIMEMHQDAGLPYAPAEDGFVFSIAEIETCIRRKIRLAQARRADLLRPCPPLSLAQHVAS